MFLSKRYCALLLLFFHTSLFSSIEENIYKLSDNTNNLSVRLCSISKSDLEKLGQKAYSSLSKTVKSSPLFFTIALFTLLFNPQALSEHPVLSTFIGTDLLANFLYNFCLSDQKLHALAKTVCQHPIISGLLAYSLTVDATLAADHPLIGIFLLGAFINSWANNID